VSTIYYGAIASNGREWLVWGVGQSRDAALRDAHHYASEVVDGRVPDAFGVVRLTHEQAQRVHSGVVSCEAIGIVWDAPLAGESNVG
jgi:hypothetical protein